MTNDPSTWTKEELVRFLAVEGMGWTLGNGTEYHAECWFDGPAIVMVEGGFDPLTDASDWLMLVMAMQKMEWQLSLDVGFEHEPSLARFINHRLFHPPDAYATLDKDIKRVVCVSAAKALLAGKEQTQ